jgi:hypothetical protein
MNRFWKDISESVLGIVKCKTNPSIVVADVSEERTVVTYKTTRRHNSGNHDPKVYNSIYFTRNYDIHSMEV